ncbi:MAG: biosynthetic-type acetolactate synthase large subunit [Salinivirgaceae bacterium]|nr:biosynthetic-type acetolactate synthase large subunit [Salinivirgaceae bacterium]
MQDHTKSQKVTGSEALLLSLIAANVDTIFGYPGGAIMPLYDKLLNFSNRLRHILTRHEQGAIHAAQGYARSTGKTGVCFATSGPGATNLITGIADAMADSTPVVCFTAQVGSMLLGTDAFQETDVVGVSMPITKWNYQITNPNEIPAIIAKAFYIASNGRPGPVLIDITKDALIKDCDYSYTPCNYIRSYVPSPAIKEEKVKWAADIINAAKKPMIVFGQGVILGHAEKELLEFVEKSGIPCASTMLGLSAMPNNHPLYKGMVGMHGNVGPNRMSNQCDLLIAIGMRFDDRVTGDVARYAKQAKIIHLEIDKAEINKIVKVDVWVRGDVKESLPMITKLINKGDHSDMEPFFAECEAEEMRRVINPLLNPKEGKITMGEVIDTLNKVSAEQAIVVTDVGQQQMISARYARFQNSRSFLSSGGLGTMGFGLPAAVGAQIGCPNRKVVAILGDGGFQMTMQELGTIIQEKLPVKVIIMNNSYLGNVRQWQELFFNHRYSSVAMNSNPDFVRLASAYNIDAEMVNKREDLKSAIERMYNSESAYILEVQLEEEGNVFPIVPLGKATDEMLYGDENK